MPAANRKKRENSKSSEGAAADKSETDEIEKSRQMQFEARAAAEAEKEQLFLKKSEKVPNELLVLVGGFAFFGWLQPLRHSYARYRIVAEWGTVIECVQTGLLFLESVAFSFSVPAFLSVAMKRNN